MRKNTFAVLLGGYAEYKYALLHRVDFNNLEEAKKFFNESKKKPGIKGVYERTESGYVEII